jgi:cysteine synthase
VSNTYDGKVIAEVFDVENDDAIRAGREVAQQEGLLVGISAGAALFAAADSFSSLKIWQRKAFCISLPSITNSMGKRYETT